MGNMNYCKYENTYRDLKDCYDDFEDTDLSESETKYRRKLIKLCCDIAMENGCEIDINLINEV